MFEQAFFYLFKNNGFETTERIHYKFTYLINPCFIALLFDFLRGLDNNSYNWDPGYIIPIHHYPQLLCTYIYIYIYKYSYKNYLNSIIIGMLISLSSK